MLFALMLPNFIAAAGITVIASILGISSEIFQVSQGQAMWLMTAFMLTYASFMPIIGRLSDTYGKKKLFVTSISIFTIGLLVSAVTGNFAVIILGRLIQGLGAAGILPITNAIVSEMFPKEKGKYLAMVNASYGLGVIVGVNIGGITYEALGWRWMFLIPFIVSLISIVTAVLFIKSKETVKLMSGKKIRIDITGSLLFALSIIGFIFTMDNLSSSSILSLRVLIPLSGMILSFVLFIFKELNTEYPAIDLASFKNTGFLIYNLLALFFGIAMFIFTTFLPSFVQAFLGYSVSSSVYAIDPFAGAMIVFIMFGGTLIKRYGPRTAMIIGSFLFALGGFSLAILTLSEFMFYVNSIFLAVGLGISMTPMNYIIIEEGGIKNQGASAGIVSIMRSLGGVIGPTIAGLIMSHIDFSSLFVMDNILNAYSKIFSFASYSIVILLLLSIVGLIMYKRKLKLTKEASL